MPGEMRGKQIIRGKILYYLKLIYPQSATLPLLQGELEIFGYPASIDDLEFDVAYLAERGLVAVEDLRPPAPGMQIKLARITLTGIDALAGRVPLDDGISVEPFFGITASRGSEK